MSLPGLEILDDHLFVAVETVDYFEALIKSLAKLSDIEQLDCKLHELDLGLLDWLDLDWSNDLNRLNDLVLVRDDLELQGEGLTEFAALRTTEAELELEDLVGDESVVGHHEGDSQLEVLHSVDLGVDGDIHNFDGHTGDVGSFIHTEEDSLLPAPVGVVPDFDVVEDDLAGLALKDDVGVRDDDSALHLVLAFAVGAMTVGTFAASSVAATLSAHELPGVLTLAVDAHLLKEATDHLLPHVPLAVAMIARLGSTLGFLAVVAHHVLELLLHLLKLGFVSHLLPLLLHGLPFGFVSSELPLLLHGLPLRLSGTLLPLLLHLLPVGLLTFSTFLVENGHHEGRGTAGLPDLEEGVVVAEVLLAPGAVVEVLAHCALVANSSDGSNSAPVALHAGVLHQVFGLLSGLLGVLTLHELVEDARDGLL